MIFDEPIWEEQPSSIDTEDLYGSDRMYMRGDTLKNIGKSLLAGNSIRHTARLTGVSKVTVRKLYRILLATFSKSGKDDILCKCGQPITHQGWCKYRYNNSPKRQAFMKKWHKSKSKGDKIMLPKQEERATIANKALDEGDVNNLRNVYEQAENDLTAMIDVMPILVESNTNSSKQSTSNVFFAMRDVALKAIELAKIVATGQEK